ncbi:MAG: hypothetical protein J5829_09065 [Lachnospiraceae bacterium]|nr:hypothetical protein [Lachnospiraceae bacterium]
MNTERSLEKLFADDEKVRDVIDRFVSIRIGQMREILGKNQKWLGYVMNDLIWRDGLCREACEDMTYAELVRLLDAERHQCATWTGSRDSVYESYASSAEWLSLTIKTIGDTNLDAKMFLMLPVERLIECLYIGKEARREKKMKEIMQNYWESDKKDGPGKGAEMPVEQMISRTILSPRTWSPATISIEEYRTRRMTTCRLGARLMIESISDGLWDQYDTTEILSKYSPVHGSDGPEYEETEEISDEMKGE